MYYKTLSDEKLAKEREIQKRTAEYLAQLSDILSSKRFSTWLSQIDSRFDWATDELFGRLTKDLMFQVGQALENRDLRQEAPGTQFKHLAELCDAVVEKLGHDLEATIKDKDRKFVVRKGEQFSERLFEFLSRGDTSFLRSKGQNFYLWNAVSSLIVYTQARDTLSCDTGNKAFERFLKTLKPAYMLNGYPHDILSFDAGLVRARKNIVSLVVRSTYCSTHAIFEGDELPTGNGDHSVINLRLTA